MAGSGRWGNTSQYPRAWRGACTMRGRQQRNHFLQAEGTTFEARLPCYLKILPQSKERIHEPESAEGGIGDSVGAGGLVARLILGCDKSQRLVSHAIQRVRTGPRWDDIGGRFRRPTAGGVGITSAWSDPVF